MFKHVDAENLTAGHKVYTKQVEGRIITLKTPAVITHVWRNADCITILTKRGYVEYNFNDSVQVA